MPSPGVKINLFDATVYAPATSNAIVGCVGPATKGPVNQLMEFTDEGNFVTRFGRPLVERMYAQRAAIRYLKRGSALKFVRVAGSLLARAWTMLLAADGLTSILRVEAASEGTWANGGMVQVAVVHNTDGTYNIYVYREGQAQESYLRQDNGIIETNVNGASALIRVSLQPGVGAAPPAETVNVVTGAIDKVSLSGGNDGAFASTESPDSTTGPVAGKRFYGEMDATAGSRVWHNLITIGTSLTGLGTYYGTLGTPAVPGTVTLRFSVGAGSHIELSDSAPGAPLIEQSGVGVLEPAAGGHKGFIDYRTGRFGVALAAATFFVGGTIDGIWVRGEAEAVGSTTRGLGDYAGGFSQWPIAPGFYNANKAVITYDVEEQVGDVPLGAAGASSASPLLKSLSGWIVPGTVVLTPTDVAGGQPVPPPIYDDGFGGFRTAPDGGGIAIPGGAIDYRTGAWAVTTWDPIGGVLFPAATAAQVQAEYTAMLVNQGGGPIAGAAPGVAIGNEVLQPSDAGGDANAADSDGGAIRATGSMEPGNVVLVISDVAGVPETYYDDGFGGWLTHRRGDPRAVAAAGGALDYDTGAWSITASAAITAGASISISYVSVARQWEARSLRGSTSQVLGSGAEAAWGLKQSAPAAGNTYRGSDWLNHATGEFSFSFNLQTTGVQQFNLKDGGALTAIYAAASILGRGDGITTQFAGTLAPAPFRREDDRLRAFQAGQVSLAGAGETQVAKAEAASSPANDGWLQNVATVGNSLSFGTGATVIVWTGAPARDEAVFVLAEDTVLHVASRYPGDIGNERSVLTDGLWVDVGADPTLSGTLRLRVWFGSTVEESFGQAYTLEELESKVNDATSGSDLVRVTLTTRGVTLVVDTDSLQSIGMAGAFTAADVIGAKNGTIYTGMQHFRNEETVPVHFLMVPGQWHRQVITALTELCEKPGRRAIGIVPIPDADDPFVHRDFINGEYNAASPGGPARATVTVPFPPQALLNSSQLVAAAPWVRYLDGYANADTWEPFDGELAQLIGNTDNVAAPWFPVAGPRRGRLFVDELRYSADREDRDLLYGVVGNRTECLNVAIEKTGRGLLLFGQRTTQRAPSATDRLNVRWTVNILMNLIDFVSQDFLFELNDTILWREAEAALNSVIAPIVERRGLQDAHIVVDATTTTADDIDKLRMRGKLFIKPARAVEEIEYDLILTPTGVSFDEVRTAG